MKFLALFLLVVSQIASAQNITTMWANVRGTGEIIDTAGPEPVSSWCFNGSNGDDCTGALDFANFGNPVYGAAAGGPPGFAVTLDGDDALKRAGQNIVYEAGAAASLTMTFWVWPDSAQKFELITINEIHTTNRTLFQIEFQDNGGFKYRVQAETGGSWATDAFENLADDLWVPGRWNYVVATWDGTTATLHVDSTIDQSNLVEIISATHSIGGVIPQCPENSCVSFVADSWFGARNGGTQGVPSTFLTGKIGLINLYNQVLTPQQMEAARDD